MEVGERRAEEVDSVVTREGVAVLSLSSMGIMKNVITQREAGLIFSMNAWLNEGLVRYASLQVVLEEGRNDVVHRISIIRRNKDGLWETVKRVKRVGH